MIFEVLLPYGFLLEYNEGANKNHWEIVLLPYGFLLEYNRQGLGELDA